MAKGFRFPSDFFPFHDPDLPFDCSRSLDPSVPGSKMKILPLIALILSIAWPSASYGQPSLGDWSNRHREADNLTKQGEYEEAIRNYELVLKGRLPFQGKKHRDVGATHNNSGVAYFYLGETQKAEEAFGRALESLLPTVGAKHPDVLTVQANLAFVDESKNRFKKAEKAFLLCIQGKLPVVGSKHPDIADCREGLALALEGQQKHKEAMEQMKLALEIRLEKLGGMHTDVAAAYAGMAVILLNQGKFDQADKMDGKARKILSATKGLYPVNKNKVSRLSPEPAEILRAKNKSLRIP